VDHVGRLYKRYGTQFGFWEYHTVMDRVSFLDPGLAMNAKVLVAPAAVEVEKRLPTFIKFLWPHELASIMYCFARYDRRTRLKFSHLISRSLLRQIPGKRERFGKVWLGPFLTPEGKAVGNPQEVFTATRAAQPKPDQQLACCAWVRSLPCGFFDFV
jgi:hypothetical protein